MHIFPHFRLNPAGRTDVVGGPHTVRGPQVARDCSIVNKIVIYIMIIEVMDKAAQLRGLPTA